MEQSVLITMLADFLHKLAGASPSKSVEEIDLLLCRWMLDNNIYIGAPSSKED